MFVRQPAHPRLAQEHEKARQLRYLGASVRAIASAVGVSQSTVSVWVRDIELLPRHRAANLKRAADCRREVWKEQCRARRMGFQESGRERATGIEPLHVAGCMLYWAEGSKSKNTLQFCNSDPAMHAMFIRFLRECFVIPDDQFRFSINAYTSRVRTIDAIEAYWLDLLKLPPECTRKHTTNNLPTSSSGKKVNKLPNGVLTLCVAKSTWLVQHIYGAIQEYSGIDQPTWLDGHY